MGKLFKAGKAALRKLGSGRVRVVSVPAPVEGKLLAGRLALISGGTGGIGLEIARSFIAQGCKVVVGSTRLEKAQGACETLGSDDAHPLVIDIRDAESLPAKVDEAASSFPDLPGVGILVNCAGVGGGHRFGATTVEEWDRVLETNLRGSWFLAQAAFNHMVENGIEGNILNVSSSSALRNARSPYEVSKWGVKGMTMGMAEMCIPHGIVVNAIGPGPTATAMLGKDPEGDIAHPANPSGRLATPREIAQLAVTLVSDAGRLIVGDTLYVTGGAGTICIDR